MTEKRCRDLWTEFDVAVIGLLYVPVASEDLSRQIEMLAKGSMDR